MFNRVLKGIRQDSGFAIMSIGNSLASVFGALFYLYFASIVSVTGYGEVNYIISFTLAAYAISSLGLDTAIMTFVPKNRHRIMDECFSVVLISSILSSVVTGFILRDLVAAIMVFSLTCLFMSLVELVTTRKYKEHALVSIGSRLCQIVLSLLLYYLIGLDGFILGYSISCLIFGYRFFIGLKNFNLHLVEIKKVWRFIAQVYGANTSYALLSYLDKIIVGNFFGYYVLGTYQVSFQFYMFLSILPVTLFNYILPHQAGGSLKRNMKIIGLGIICIVTILAMFLAPVIVPYLLPNYTHAIRSIQIIILATIPLTLVALLRANILAQGDRTSIMLFAGLASLTTEVFAIIILGSLFGTEGISWALVFTMSLECIILLIANKRKIF